LTTSGTVSAKPSLAKAKITKAKTTRGQAKVSWKKVSGVTKMSCSRICHAPGTRYCSQTKCYTAYSSLSKCLAAGGRKPLR